MKILILGASYGSLLSTKLLMCGHDVSLICREQSAALINDEGTIVRLTLRGESEPRIIRSNDLPGNVDAVTPEQAKPEDYDLVGLAMQEPQYGAGPVQDLLQRIAASARPSLSIMNMPPLPFLRRIDSLAETDFDECYTHRHVWDGIEPGRMALCSPDPQAFRPPEEKSNFLHVGLPTNFKATGFADPAHTVMLHRLESDIDSIRLDGKEVPVKLRVSDSLFVPMAKWSMLLAGNYRCVTADGAIPIREAVHYDLEASRSIYDWVGSVSCGLGANPDDLVPFEKYANAAENLLSPSSAARAVNSGAANIERVDKLVQTIGEQLGMRSDAVDEIVATIDGRLAQNRKAA